MNQMMMKNIQLIAILLACLLLGGPLSAQEVNIKASVDSANVLIGDQLRLKFEIEQAKDIQLKLPHFTDTITQSVEVVEAHPLDTLATADAKLLSFVQELTIQSFDTGLQVIPAQEFKYQIDTTEHLLQSNPVAFYVHPGFPVDSIQHPVGLKAPYEAPINLAEASPYLLGIILLAAIAFFIFYYLNYLAKKRAGKEDEGPKEPAHIIALRELDRIKTAEVWKNEARAKEYFIDLSDAVRTYIQNRYSINALEYTTMEIMHAFKSRKDLLEKKNHDQLKALLELADLVKFAKLTPQDEECERSLSTAFLFVKDTMVFESEAKTEKPKSEKTEKAEKPADTIDNTTHIDPTAHDDAK